MDAVNIKNFYWKYPNFIGVVSDFALKNINLTVKPGEFFGITGPSGAGKTSLCFSIAGLIPHQMQLNERDPRQYVSGTVKVADLDLHDVKNRRNMPRHVGYVFQNPDHQIFNRNVYAEVAYGLKNMGVSQSVIEERVNTVLKSVNLIDKIKEDPLFLGRGQKRRLGVASVLAMHPEIIIVDEPTTGQDYKMSKEIMQLLKKLNEDGTTIIVITHDMRLVAEFCPRSIVMNQGKIVYDGSTFDLFKNDKVLETASLRAPQIVRLSKEMVKVGISDDIMLTSEDVNRAYGKWIVIQNNDK
ncbi:MAG: energy-coupling factor ABC transporter ATP-binding protein [Athalassotoga sp.]|uniref:energy-coupling factor ABC transporter ATP-binding protein n=1 Tax=Athalassotoga sp. TaxID=2022597 RepID=UPI003D089C53